MAKLLIFLDLCVLPAVVIATGRPLPVAYEVEGGVYCDTCQLGCQHQLSTPIKINLDSSGETLDAAFTCQSIELEIAADHLLNICNWELIPSARGSYALALTTISTYCCATTHACLEGHRGVLGAEVKVQCKDSDNKEVVYERKGVTGADGKYSIEVRDDHQEEICDVVLVKSSQNDCAEIVQGLDRARVILTNNNGIISNKRYANYLGFRKAEKVAGCDKLVQLFSSEDV
ncbi:Pollen Ole e 1 allergen/extensin [Macleaya cordata]|uniref:Pollen Ole e 1 allergen/extensin n=1 Tax=Macleaya cordata TaxID=56857 RepID=A0A200PY71_MACCD|nr:Pollen Ole e 1 allergen/extensin [Macleaya cordata]